ncbi:MAG: hypothetical protein KRP56_03840 [Candidatus Methanogranum gryphiswaldense]|nr:MAG: hypothetical protein KRP56_03840 [Candidatus Methanogranum sp. U3.2.1]
MMALFETGTIMMTSGIRDMANDMLFRSVIDKAPQCYMNGDRGSISDDDKEANDDALKNDDRLFSSYHIGRTKI